MNSSNSQPISNILKGTLAGILAATAFGFIPLFSIPLRQSGMEPDTLLFYRFLFASAMLAIVMAARKISFNISPSSLIRIFSLALIYCVSSGFLLWGYDFMSSGIATVIHFTYPIIVALIMYLIYKEHISASTLFSIIAAIVGIYMLSVYSHSDDIGGKPMTLIGFIVVLLSGVAYASYIVIINKSKVRHLNPFQLTFWVMLSACICFFVMSVSLGHFTYPSTVSDYGNLVGLSFICTIVANLALLVGIKHIGGTITSALGALEPLTAVVVGIIVLHEPINTPISIGIALILAAVTIIVINRKGGH